MELVNISSKEYRNSHFSLSFFLNLYNSVAITCTLFRFSVVILDTIKEGQVPQIFDLGLSSVFMLFRK